MKTGSVILKFNNDISFNQKGKHVRDGLSGALITGKNLWISCDERSSLERLTLLKDGSYGNHQSFELNKLLDLPDCKHCEIDIEGLALESDKYLWLIGSHSLSRKKPKKSNKPAIQIESLAKVKKDPNRYLLARIPLVLDPQTGNFNLVKSYNHPENSDLTLTSAQLKNSKKGNQLMEILSHDLHLKHFLNIPGKDNGFDIEGLAVEKNKIFIGIRGPVLRGWAILLEIMVKDHSDGYFKLKSGKKDKLYKKHFIQLDGMGIRDLKVVGDDLLILAGPTMDLDGTIAVYRWEGGVKQQKEAIVRRLDLTRLFDVPHGSGDTRGQDKAEGMALYDNEHVLIVFDTPTDGRKPNESDVIGDLYNI